MLLVLLRLGNSPLAVCFNGTSQDISHPWLTFTECQQRLSIIVTTNESFSCNSNCLLVGGMWYLLYLLCCLENTRGRLYRTRRCFCFCWINCIFSITFCKVHFSFQVCDSLQWTQSHIVGQEVLLLDFKYWILQLPLSQQASSFSDFMLSGINNVLREIDDSSCAILLSSLAIP